MILWSQPQRGGCGRAGQVHPVPAVSAAQVGTHRAAWERGSHRYVLDAEGVAQPPASVQEVRGRGCRVEEMTSECGRAGRWCLFSRGGVRE